MKRIFVITATAMLALSLAAPAYAARPEVYRSADRSANAFWSSIEWVAGGAYIETVWYVGAYEGDDGLWADVYRDVLRCEERSEEEGCSLVSATFGIIEDPTFTIDAKKLAVAHLEGTAALRSYEGKGRRSGPVERIEVSVDWEGTGRTSRGRGSSSYHSGCSSFRDTYRGRYRAALATGSAGGEDLGTTEDASLATSTWTSVWHDC